MKTLVVGFTLFFSGLAFADTEHNIKVNRIEMTEAATGETDEQKDDSDSLETRATDYNSSRSNRGDSVKLDDVLEDEDESETNGTRATDYNSSRSNKADSAQAPDIDETDDSKATDYNSSRSNKSFSAATVNDCDESDKETVDCATP